MEISVIRYLSQHPYYSSYFSEKEADLYEASKTTLEDLAFKFDIPEESVRQMLACIGRKLKTFALIENNKLCTPAQLLKQPFVTFDIRLKNALFNYNKDTYEDVLNWNCKELLQCPNVGYETVDILIADLLYVGFKEEDVASYRQTDFNDLDILHFITSDYYKPYFSPIDEEYYKLRFFTDKQMSKELDKSISEVHSHYCKVKDLWARLQTIEKYCNLQQSELLEKPFISLNNRLMTVFTNFFVSITMPTYRELLSYDRDYYLCNVPNFGRTCLKTLIIDFSYLGLPVGKLIGEDHKYDDLISYIIKRK